MKKKRLEIDYSYDFELLGVISSAKGYKLAWDMNNHLGIRLIKQQDLTIQFANQITGTYSHFSHDSPLNRIKLFKNKPNETDTVKYLLVQEFPHFDYIVMSQGADKIDSNRLQEYLRAISSVEMVAFIPLDALKAKDYFIF
ncbi:MAG TPA: IPExxxVDY family protein [Cyclobacteriaceae bacterium]|nr:IPExxxVDY family protein [Cyclobacteriaceae bacterium]